MKRVGIHYKLVSCWASWFNTLCRGALNWLGRKNTDRKDAFFCLCSFVPTNSMLPYSSQGSTPSALFPHGENTLVLLVLNSMPHLMAALCQPAAWCPINGLRKRKVIVATRLRQPCRTEHCIVIRLVCAAFHQYGRRSRTEAMVTSHASHV